MCIRDRACSVQVTVGFVTTWITVATNRSPRDAVAKGTTPGAAFSSDALTCQVLPACQVPFATVPDGIVRVTIVTAPVASSAGSLSGDTPLGSVLAAAQTREADPGTEGVGTVGVGVALPPPCEIGVAVSPPPCEIGVVEFPADARGWESSPPPHAVRAADSRTPKTAPTRRCGAPLISFFIISLGHIGLLFGRGCSHFTPDTLCLARHTGANFSSFDLLIAGGLGLSAIQAATKMPQVLTLTAKSTPLSAEAFVKAPTLMCHAASLAKSASLASR